MRSSSKLLFTKARGLDGIHCDVSGGSSASETAILELFAVTEGMLEEGHCHRVTVSASRNTEPSVQKHLVSEGQEKRFQRPGHTLAGAQKLYGKVWLFQAGRA